MNPYLFTSAGVQGAKPPGPFRQRFWALMALTQFRAFIVHICMAVGDGSMGLGAHRCFQWAAGKS